MKQQKLQLFALMYGMKLNNDRHILFDFKAKEQVKRTLKENLPKFLNELYNHFVLAQKMGLIQGNRPRGVKENWLAQRIFSEINNHAKKYQDYKADDFFTSLLEKPELYLTSPFKCIRELAKKLSLKVF